MDTLSLWRSPLDAVALHHAILLRERQPRGTIVEREDLSAMTIYNYDYYLAEEGGSNYNGALNTMLTVMAAASPVGGAAFFQHRTNPVSASTDGFPVPDQTNLTGSGGGGSEGSPNFYHFTITFSGESQLFLNCTNTGYTSGGIYFRGLGFFGSATAAGDTCIYADTLNCRAINCTFTDIPTVFNAQGTGCGLQGCTIVYETLPRSATSVILAGSQCFALGPGVFFQKPQSKSPYLSCTCISVEGPADHSLIGELHISDWNIGIDFSQGAGSQHTQIRNCEIECWQSALNIQLPADAEAQYTVGIKVTSCSLCKEGDSTDPNPVVVVDAQLLAGYGNTNAQLSDITLLDCTVYNRAPAASLMSQHGLAILGGQNIKVIGGTYSNNSPAGGAGIAILGACGDVQIIGVNLQQSYDDGKSSATVNMQQYALLVAANPAGKVLVSGCDMTGYRSGVLPSPPVSVTASPTSLLILDCPGYSDQNTPLNGGAAPTSSTSAATCTTPYFGPSVISFVNASPVQLVIFGQTFTMRFGSIYVPSPYDSFYFEGTGPTHFTWYGT
jgi:hypothetical protein